MLGQNLMQTYEVNTLAKTSYLLTTMVPYTWMTRLGDRKVITLSIKLQKDVV